MIEYLPLVLTGIGIMASILYYANILRNAEKAKRKEILLQRINIIDEDFYNKWVQLFQQEWTTFSEWHEYRKDHPEAYGFITYLMMTLNTMGIMLKQNLVDEKTLFDAFTPPIIIWSWNRTKPIIMGWRETINIPDYHSGFEFLAKRANELYPDMRQGDAYRQARDEYIKAQTNR